MVLQVRTLLLESEKNFIQMEKKVSHLLSQKSPNSTNFMVSRQEICFGVSVLTSCLPFRLLTMSVIHRDQTKVAAIPHCALCWILGDSLSITECEIDAGREGVWISNPLILAKKQISSKVREGALWFHPDSDPLHHSGSQCMRTPLTAGQVRKQI